MRMFWRRILTTRWTSFKTTSWGQSTLQWTPSEKSSKRTKWKIWREIWHYASRHLRASVMQLHIRPESHGGGEGAWYLHVEHEEAFQVLEDGRRFQNLYRNFIPYRQCPFVEASRCTSVHSSYQESLNELPLRNSLSGYATKMIKWSSYMRIWVKNTQ